MQYSGIDIQSITQLLSSVSRFSQNIDQMSNKLLQASPESLGPALGYLAHMITLPPQNKKVLTSVLALRLIKQTFLQGSYKFYVNICSYIVPILCEYFYKDSINLTKFNTLEQFLSLKRCKQLLKQKWYIQSNVNFRHSNRKSEQGVNQAEIKQCGYFLELVYQFIQWSGQILKQYPSSTQQFKSAVQYSRLNFSSIFKILNDQNPDIFEENKKQYRFFKENSAATFYHSLIATSQSQSAEIIRYCSYHVEEILFNQSVKSMRKIHQILYFTADSLIISAIITQISDVIQDKVKGVGIPSFKDTNDNLIYEYLNKAIEIGRVRAYSLEGITSSIIFQNQSGYEELEYQCQLALKIIPLYFDEIFEKSKSKGMLYNLLNKLLTNCCNLEDQLGNRQLNLKAIYQELVKAVAVSQNSVENDDGAVNTTKNRQRNQLCIFTRTNQEKLSKLIPLYAKDLSDLLQQIKKKSKNEQTGYPHENLFSSSNKFNQNSPILLKRNSSSNYQLSQQQNKQYPNKPNELNSNIHSQSSRELSVRTHQRLYLKRMATLQRERDNGQFASSNKRQSSISEPNKITNQMLRSGNLQIQPNFGVSETSRSFQNRESSLNQRIQKRKVQIKERRSSFSKSKQSNYNFYREKTPLENQNIISQYYTPNQSIKTQSKNYHISFQKLNSPNNHLKASQENKGLDISQPASISSKKSNEILSNHNLKNQVPIYSYKNNIESPDSNRKGLQLNIVKQLQRQSLRQSQKQSPQRNLYYNEKVLRKIQMKQLNRKTKNNHHPQSGNIMMEPTITKPPFSFKNIDGTPTIVEASEIISETSQNISSKQSDLFNHNSNVEKGKVQNFADVLQLPNQDHSRGQIKVVKNGNMTGYLIPATSYESREKKLIKQLESYRKQNQFYDEKIMEREIQIERLDKKLDKQRDELQAYTKNLDRAYNAYENPDSLMILSKDSLEFGHHVQDKIRNLEVFDMGIVLLKKKLFKQILYGKALLLQNEYVQIGFSNLEEEGQVSLYFLFKVSSTDTYIELQNLQESGYMTLETDERVHLRNVPQNKKIKLKFSFSYRHFTKISFIKLVIKIKEDRNKDFHVQSCPLPFCLYRNFILGIQNRNQTFYPKYITNWQPASQELRKNKKQFMNNLFKLGKWTDGSYFMTFLFKGQYVKVNIIFSGKNFAIEFEKMKNQDLLLTLGSLFAKNI